MAVDGRAVNAHASCAGSLEFKSYTALQTVRHCFDIYAGSCVALALLRGDGLCKLFTRFGVIRQVL